MMAVPLPAGCRNPRVHEHPILRRPISIQKFVDELVLVAGRSGAFDGAFRYRFTKRLTAIHNRNARRYAEVELETHNGVVIPTYSFAEQARCLPKAHRLGLMAPEVGHAILLPGEHTEAQADQAALTKLGVKITYDKRWPGKGLQKGRHV